MNKFDIRKWNRLNESTGHNKRMTEDEKKQTLEAVSRFNELGQNIYKTNEISELVETVKMMAENASRMAIEETADWFDAVSVKRDTKSIGESIKMFEGTFKEISTLQQRLESVFEDMGAKLGKYYEIKELNETEAQDKYQAKFKDALEDEGVDSPADLDDEEKKDFFNKIDKMHKGKNESRNKTSFQGDVNEAFEGMRSVISTPGVSINMKSAKPVNEGFATWKMSFADMNLSGVELRKSKTYTVKARSTVEAIKKAAKMAGIKGDGWMATQTHKLEKVG
tara:strand:+ start:2623 stop:3462 length:840 start_codon:yes stop_codon:yes gene_type:complete